MALIRYRPFHEVSLLQRDMSDLLQRFFGQSDLADLQGSEGSWLPVVNVSETSDNVIVEAEIPGMAAKDLEVSVTGDVLTLKGEKKEEAEQSGQTWHRTERTYGSFTRSFKLPAQIVNDKVAADYKNGVLTVTLPKSAASRVQEVTITCSRIGKTPAPTASGPVEVTMRLVKYINHSPHHHHTHLEDFGALGARYDEVDDAWHPPVNILETSDHVRFEMEVPGVDPEDINVSATGGSLVVRGIKRRTKETQEVQCARSERRFGSFARAFKLRTAIDNEKVSADFHHGLLVITLPKAAAAGSQQIEIKSE